MIAATAAAGAPVSDLAVERMDVPARVVLAGARGSVTARAVVRVVNRGAVPVSVPDATTLDGFARLSATGLEGPVACAAPGIRLVTGLLRFPLTLAPGRGHSLRYDLDIGCGATPGPGPDWAFSAFVDHTALDGSADDDPGNDLCPRPPNGSDPGCGVVRAGGSIRPPVTDVRSSRSTTRFEVSGPYGVGETSLMLIDPSRPTMANGSFAGAPDRPLPTTVWYPTAPSAEGPGAALARSGRPFPLIVFAHALGSYAAQSSFLTRHLASHGYIVAAPAFPLMQLGAPGGSTIADVAAQAGDVSFVIDAFRALAGDARSLFADGVDTERVGLAGHSGGALTTLVATFDARVREPRIKAAVAFAPPACFLQNGYFDAAAVPLLIVQGDQDLLTDVGGDAGAVYARARPPKSLLIVRGGTHLGFADAGAAVGDGFVCSLFPDRTDLDAQIGALLSTLGGPTAHVGVEGCPTAYCTGDLAHVGGPRQLQIGKEAALAFFEQVLRGSRKARRYLETLPTRNGDLILGIVRGGRDVPPDRR